MSMLSAQTKKLRQIADLFDGFGYENSARDIRDAADTIDELRLRCQELQEREWQTCHNAHVDSVEDLAAWFECSECGARDIMNDHMHYCCNCGRRIAI